MVWDILAILFIVVLVAGVVWSARTEANGAGNGDNRSNATRFGGP